MEFKDDKCIIENCVNKQKFDKYCGKHKKYYNYQILSQQGINVCNIDRGCLNPILEGYTKCEKCLNVSRKKDESKLIKVSQLKSIVQEGKTICNKCKCEFDNFQNLLGMNSTKCRSCYEKQRLIEQNRVRVR